MYRTVAFMMILILSAVSVQAQQPALEDSPCVFGKPCAAKTEFGDFLLNAQLESEKYGSPKLKGQIINNTSKDWMDLEFKVKYLDWRGNIVETILDTIRVPSMKHGESFSLGYGYGEAIIFKEHGLKASAISRLEFALLDGKIPAQYTFVLLKRKPTQTGPAKVIESRELADSDNLTDFSFTISKRQFSFVLVNKGDEPIEIDWNRVAYVDVSGESHKVIHSGVRYIDRDKPLAPTTIPPSARLEDIIFPADYVYYSEGKYGGWREAPLFPDGKIAESYRGKEFTAFIPLKVGGAIKNYTFRFKILDAAL